MKPVGFEALTLGVGLGSAHEEVAEAQGDPAVPAFMLVPTALNNDAKHRQMRHGRWGCRPLG